MPSFQTAARGLKTALALTFLFAISTAATSQAGDIYVSSTNGDDAFDGSQFDVLGGGVGPKQTIEGALAIAAAGDVLIIQAGSYVPNGGLLTIGEQVTIQVTALGGSTEAVVDGDVTIASNVTVTTGANSFAIGTGGSLTLLSGQLTVVTPGDLTLPTGATITRIAGSIAGNAPAFGTDTFIVYNDDSSGATTTAGMEMPSSLGTGTITIDQALGSLEFPNPVSAAGITVAPGTDVDVTFYSNVVGGGDVRRSEGARGDLTFTDLELGENNLINGERTGTLSVLGTLGFTANKNDEVAEPAINNAAGGTMTLGNVVFAGVAQPSPGTDQMRLLVNGVGGSITVRETITSQAAASTSEGTDQVHDVDVAIFQNRGSVIIRGSATVEHVYNTHASASVEFHGPTTLNRAVAPGLAPGSINNTLGSISFFADSQILGSVVNASGQNISFDGDASIAGDVVNAGVIALGPSRTLDLQSDAAFTNIGTIEGANAGLVVSGNGDLGPATVAGNLTVSGDGDFASALSVGGDLAVSGSGDFAAVLTVGGGLTLTGDNSFMPGSAGSSIGGTMTVDGTTVIGVGSAPAPEIIAGGVSIGASGALTIETNNALEVRGGFDDSAGGQFTANGTNAALRFVLDDDYEWTPGTNRQIDLLSIGGGNGHTLTLRESVDVVQRFTVTAGTILDVTDKLVRLSADDGVADVSGVIEASQATGALSFKANDQSLTGGGTIANLVINNADDTPVPIRLDSAATVTSKIQLFDGGLDLNGNSMTVGPAPALIERNLAGTATAIVDGAGGGSINGEYSLTYSGSIASDMPVGIEFGTDSVDNLTVLATGAAVIVEDPGSWAGGGTLSVSGDLTLAEEAHLILGAARELVVAGTVDIAGSALLSGSDGVTLTGNERTHRVAGLVTLTPGITIQGNQATLGGAASTGGIVDIDRAEISSLAVSGTEVVVTGIQSIRGDVAVLAGGTLGLGLLPSLDSDTDNGAIGGSLLIEGESFELLSDLRLSGAAGPSAGGSLHTSGSFAFGVFDLIMMTPGAAFATVPGLGATYASNGGVLAVDAATALDMNGVAIPFVTVNAPATLVSDLLVSDHLDANASILGDFGTYLSGTAALAAGVRVDGTLVSSGADLTLEGDSRLGDLTVANGLTLASDEGDASRTVTVTGTYEHLAGQLNFGSNDIVLDATLAGSSPAFVFVDGTFSGSGALVFNDNNNAAFIPVSTGGRDASVPNVTVQRNGGMAADDNDGFQIVSGDGLTVTGVLLLEGGAISFSTDQAPALSLGDGATVVRKLGALLDTPTFGALVNNTYEQSVVSGPELAGSGGALTVNANLVLAGGATPTFQRLDLNAQLDASVQADAHLNVASGGTVEVGIADPLTEPYTSDGPITLVYDGAIGAPGTTVREWPDEVTVAHLIVAADIDLGSDHSVQHLTVGTESGSADLDLAGDYTLTVTGDVLIDGASTVSNMRGAPGTNGVLEFAGDKPQLFTVPSTGFSPRTTASPSGVTLSIDNPAGVRLTGGPVVMDAAAEVMRFVSGAFDTATRGTSLTLYHQNSDNQGFVQVNGGVWGNVSKEIVNNNLPGIPPIANRLEYPLCTADCDALRNFAITFNDPSQVGPGRTGVMATARHFTNSPGSEDGLPVQTLDRSGNPLTITRYPDFHWSVSTNVVISLIDYSVEMRADGYEEFAAESIDRTVGLQREAGTASTWALLGSGPGSYGNVQDGAGNPTVVARGNIGAFELAPGMLFTYGLESTITVLDPSPVNIQSGQSAQFTLDGGVFTGGNPGNAFNYTVSSSDPLIATGSESGGVLTITGISKGLSIITVIGTDALGNSRTLAIRVNVDFVVGSVDTIVQHVGGTATLDIATVVQGGTAPFTYRVTVADTLVATASIEGSVLSVTAVGPGETTANVTATDADGATTLVVVNIVATNAVIVSAPIPDMELRVGDPAVTLDLNQVFSGAAQNLSFEVATANDQAILAVVDQTELSLATLVGDRLGLPVLVSVTAIDGLNNRATDTFEFIPLPAWGDGTVDGEVNAVDARLVLQDAVDQIRQQPGPLTEVQRATLNVTGGQLTAFDSARILQRVVGLIDCFPVESGCSTQLEDTGSGVLALADAVAEVGTNVISVPVLLTGTVQDVFGFQFESQLDLTSVTFLSANYDLPFGWISEQSLTTDGLLSVAIAGPTPITEPGAYVTLKFEQTSATATPVFSAEGFLNEGAAQSMGTVSTSIDAESTLPLEFSLKGNYPNPFNPVTTFQFDLPAPAEVSVEVVDMLGRRVLMTAPRELGAGSDQTLALDASTLPSGTYLYRMTVRDAQSLLVRTGTMILLK